MLSRCEEAPVECPAGVSSIHYAPGADLDDNSNELMGEIIRISRMDGLEACAELISTLNCIMTYPVCDITMTRLRPVCESQCQIISAELTRCLEMLPDEQFPLVTGSIFSQVACDDPESYYNFPSQYILDPTNDAECLMIGKL